MFKASSDLQFGIRKFQLIHDDKHILKSNI